jgi:hypothetical protein
MRQRFIGPLSVGRAAALCAALVATPAGAFPHVVKRGETAARIAEQMYGRIELERIVVAANGLDGRRGSETVPGMRIEIPAVAHRKVLAGDSWQSLAEELCGSPGRGDVLAFLNAQKPWLRPAVGADIIVPFNLRYVASTNDTTETVAYRFLGERDLAWVIASYNSLQRAILRQGEIVLVPLTDLALTEEGRRAAQTAHALMRSEGEIGRREAQLRADRELPLLAQDVRHGRYVEAIARGASLVGDEKQAGLSEPQLAAAFRYLTEAYVALDATAAAAHACASWRAHDPTAELDPVLVSPKIMAVCVGEPATPKEEPPAAPSASASAAPAEDAGVEP